MVSGNSRRAATSIPPEILRQARLGHDVGRLYDLVTPENCTSEVINIVFAHLPQEHAQRTLTVADRALAALTALSKVTFAAYTNSVTKEALIRHVVVSVEAICFWMDFSLPHGLVQVTPHGSNRVELRRSHLFQATTLQDLIYLDSRIQQAFISSPPFVKLLIRLWTELDDRLKACMDLGAGNGCPVIRTMLMATDSEDGKEAFIMEMMRAPTIATAFATCTVQRATQIQNEDLEIHPLPVAIRHVRWLLIIVDRFVSSSSLVRRRFTEAAYLKTYTSLLNSMSLRAVEQGTPELLVQNLRGVCTLVTLVADQNSRVIQNRREVVAGDMMALICRTVGYLATSKDSRALESGMAVVKMFSEYTLYPKVLKEIHKLTPPKFGVASMPRTSPMFEVWHTFFTSFYVRGQLPFPDAVRLCDNLPCKGRHVQREPWVSRQCSGCSSFLYCSKECQEEDWKRWHKHECSAAREEHARKVHYDPYLSMKLTNETERRLSESWYSHTTRAFHNGFIDEFFSQNLDEIDKPEARRPESSLSINEILPVVECTTIDSLIDYQNLTKPQWWGRPDKEFRQAYLWPRLTDIGVMFRSRTMPKGLRLVEAVFPMGADWEVYLTAIIRKRKDGRYETVYSIPRYGLELESVPGLRSF